MPEKCQTGYAKKPKDMKQAGESALVLADGRLDMFAPITPNTAPIWVFPGKEMNL